MYRESWAFSESIQLCRWRGRASRGGSLQAGRWTRLVEDFGRFLTSTFRTRRAHRITDLLSGSRPSQLVWNDRKKKAKNVVVPFSSRQEILRLVGRVPEVHSKTFTMFLFRTILLHRNGVLDGLSVRDVFPSRIASAAVENRGDATERNQFNSSGGNFHQSRPTPVCEDLAVTEST